MGIVLNLALEDRLLAVWFSKHKTTPSPLFSINPTSYSVELFHVFVIAWSWLRRLAVHKQEEKQFRSYPVSELWFTAKHRGGVKLARLWELEREIESERTDSPPPHTHTHKKQKDTGEGKSWSHNWNSSGCTAFLSSVTIRAPTNTDVIVCSTLARFVWHIKPD